MTVDITEVYKVYTVTRSEAGEVYPITFPFISPEYVKCYYAADKEQTQLVYGIDYTVNAQTNELTITGALPLGVQVVVYRVTDLTQEIDWVDGQSVYTPDIEQADDKLTHIVQELAKQVDRTVKVTREEEASGVNPEEKWKELNIAVEAAIKAQAGAEDAKDKAEEAEAIAQSAREAAQNAQAQAEMQAQRAIEKVESITDLTVEAETLEAGTEATASYDAEARRLFLGIPRGLNGANGAQGPEGQQGRPGPQGQAPYADVIDCGGACGTWLSTIQAGAACTIF